MYELISQDGKARRGRLQLPHGTVETPVFMPVGTVGSVKTMVPQDLIDMGAEIILGNTYHLFLRPGMQIIEEHGDLHRFTRWPRSMLTDSGGYQVFSLGKNVKLKPEGAWFSSHIDGQRFMLSPEKVVEIQETLGSDIQMVLDECTPFPVTREVAAKSLDLTLHWAQRARTAKLRNPTPTRQFGIVQGSMFADLRAYSAQRLVAMDFDGYAIGGLSVGEPKADMMAMCEVSCNALPEHKARYLMGVGTPLDIIEAVALGVDMFDCVMPTRNARNGSLFTSYGKIAIKHAKYKHDQNPLDPECPCYTCQTFTLSYLRHLHMAQELTCLRLFSLHNLTFYLRFMQKIRTAIEQGTFEALLQTQRTIKY